VNDAEPCWLCSSRLGADVVCAGYRRCRGCGHRSAAGAAQDGAVDNGVLTLEHARASDALTRAQVHATLDAAVRRRFLLDIGSGTGKFVHHIRRYFEDAVGLEVSDRSVRFAREVLRVPIVTAIDEVAGPVDVVTAWHSLEHVASGQLLKMMAFLRAHAHAESRIIVCVPNPDGPAAVLFGRRWAFRDEESHRHEFSRQSLDELFRRYGFRRLRERKLWVYSCFAWVQSICNLAPGPHNYAYHRLKRGRSFHENRLQEAAADAAAAVVLAVAVPVGVVCAAVEHLASRQTSVHVVIYASEARPGT